MKQVDQASVATPLKNYGSRRAAFRGAMKDAFGVPALVLGASYIGFGALIKETGLNVWHGVISTITGWALPGQIVLIELYALGAPLLLMAAAVALTNARLLPMAVTLMPLLRDPNHLRWPYYIAVHWVAVTGWAQALKVCPYMVQDQRLAYFLGFAAVLWSSTICATAVGFYLASSFPFHVAMGLVFLNPIYFMLVFASDLAKRQRTLAMILGAVLGPLFYLIEPDYSLMISGVIAGTLGFFFGRRKGA